MKHAIKNTGRSRYSFLILQSFEDVLTYAKLNEQIKARQAVDLWIGFKNQSFRRTLGDYAAHNASYGMETVMAMTADLRQGPVSLAEYCHIADKIIHGIHDNMQRMIQDGKLIRVNKLGGYCPVDDIDDMEQIEDIDHSQLYNFLTGGDIDYAFQIYAPVLVIENDSRIPEYTINKWKRFIGREGEEIPMQVANNFKLRTLLKTKEQLYKLFADGIEQGLRSIVFSTSGQDTRQISAFKELIEGIMRNRYFSEGKEDVLNVYISAWERTQPLFKTDLPNIQIHFLP